MTTSTKLNLKMIQGSTFKEILRWESDILEYNYITAITNSAPVEITIPGHNIPLGWRVYINSVLGMKEVNTFDTAYIVTESNTDTISIADINALNFSAYTSSGVVEHYTPTDITGYTARMQIRSKITSEEVILDLTTENDMIVLDHTLQTITINIPASTTEGFTFSSAVYSLEMISSSDEVTQLISGIITLTKEVTR